MMESMKLPYEVSDALAESVQQLEVGDNGQEISTQLGPGRMDRESGLNSFVESSEFTGSLPSETRTGDKTGWSLQDKLHAAKQARLKQKFDKKPGFRGKSPAREIGKPKKTNIALNAGLIETLRDLQNNRGVVDGPAGGMAKEGNANDGLAREHGCRKGDMVADDVIRAGVGVGADTRNSGAEEQKNLTGTYAEARQEE
jgi:hypothetical protein